jgi:hypothetical protein
VNCPSLFYFFHSLFHGGHSTTGFLLDRLDHLADFAGGAGGPLSQCPYLIGNHGKAPSHFTGTGCLNGGIQGKQVGLVGDILNGAHNGPDLVRSGSQRLYGMG